MVVEKLQLVKGTAFGLSYVNIESSIDYRRWANGLSPMPRLTDPLSIKLYLDVLGNFRTEGYVNVTSQKYREEWHGSWYTVAMRLTLPEIPEAENTSLVRQLLEIIRTQQDRIQQLEDEILRLKGLKTRPVIAPSPLEHPPRPPREPGQKRPGSAKRSKTAQLAITDEVVVPLADVPPGSAFKGYEDFVVQDLEIRPRVTRYRRERWRSPDGRNLVAPLPEGVR